MDYPEFYDCGICGHYHPAEWDGDCRDDKNRFTGFELDEKYGTDGWEEVDMPEYGEPRPGKGLYF